MLTGFKTYAQCALNDATTCLCDDGTDTCALLPDIVVSEIAISEVGGTAEFGQNGNSLQNGQFMVTGATPNIGYGPLSILGTDTFICGVDTTVTTIPPNCSDGSLPGRTVIQRIYQKTGSVMSYYEVVSGTMRYHGVGHDHLHVDDWLHVSLRIRDSTETDPREWPILGEAAKISFCLADFRECTQTNGYCRDTNSVILDSTNILNFGLGNNYNTCSSEQGISVGYMDIYDLNIPGMNLTIPYGTRNGQYWVVNVIDFKIS